MSGNDEPRNEQTLIPGQAKSAAVFPPNPPHYQITKLLGKGGSGAVYQARDLRLGRDVAIKFLHRGDDHWYARFQREARALALVDHSRFCRIYEFGEVANQPFLVMQLLRGRTLEDAGLDLRECLAVIRDLARALHEAHAAGLIHRDLKPGNIMICRDGEGKPQPFVLDFGLAHLKNQSDLTVTGDILGTPGFMSPEQARGETAVSDLTDVYGLGATLYDVLVGKPPFDGSTPESVLQALLSKEPVRPRLLVPGLPREVEIIIMTCLAREPERRYQGVQALADDLDRYLKGRLIEAQAPSLLYRVSRVVRRHRALVFLTVTAVILLLGSLLWGRIESQRREDLARRVAAALANIENTSRLTFLARKHLIGPRQAEIRGELLHLEDLIEAEGAATRAAGEQALGLGYLALKDTPRALDFLQASWERGHRSPELTHGLGLAYSLLYRERMARVMVTQQAQSPEVLAETRRLRQQALFFMQHPSMGEAERAGYLEALIAFCEGRYEAALGYLDGATQLPPWFYEAEQLRAASERQWAIQLSRQGDLETADLRFHNALVAGRQAIAIGASDPENYRVLARSHLDMLVQGLHRGYGREDSFSQGLQVLEDLEMVLPQDGEAALLRARLWHMTARSLREERGDVSIPLAASLVALAQARQGPAAAERVDRQEGALFWLWAQWLADRRLPATEMAQRALDVLARIPENRRDYFVHFTMGSAYRNLAQGMERKGEAAGWAYECSIDALSRARHLQPEGIEAANSLAMTFYHLARVRGPEQATTYLQRAETVLLGAIEVHDHHPVLFYQLGRVYLRSAQAGKHSLDKAYADMALAAFEKARVLNPRLGRAYERISRIWLLRAQEAWDRGEDYSGPLEAGLAICEQGLAMNSRLTYLSLNQTFLLYFKAKYLLRRGENPTPALDEAAQVALTLKGVEALLTRGSIERLRGEWSVLNGEDPSASLARAGAAFDEILKQKPQHEEAKRSLGRLLTLKAAWQWANGGDAGPLCDQAEAALAQGSRDSPLWLSARTRLAVLQGKSGRSVDVTTLLAALAEHGDRPEMMAARASLLELKGDTQAAEALMKRVHEANPWLRFSWRLQGQSGY